MRLRGFLAGNVPSYRTFIGPYIGLQTDFAAGLVGAKPVKRLSHDARGCLIENRISPFKCHPPTHPHTPHTHTYACSELGHCHSFFPISKQGKPNTTGHTLPEDLWPSPRHGAATSCRRPTSRVAAMHSAHHSAHSWNNTQSTAQHGPTPASACSQEKWAAGLSPSPLLFLPGRAMDWQLVLFWVGSLACTGGFIRVAALQPRSSPTPVFAASCD